VTTTRVGGGRLRHGARSLSPNVAGKPGHFPTPFRARFGYLCACSHGQILRAISTRGAGVDVGPDSQGWHCHRRDVGCATHGCWQQDAFTTLPRQLPRGEAVTRRSPPQGRKGAISLILDHQLSHDQQGSLSSSAAGNALMGCLLSACATRRWDEEVIWAMSCAPLCPAGRLLGAASRGPPALAAADP
jgi:hypothetical protein